MKKKRTFSPEMIEACKKTVLSYWRLIRTGDASEWGEYGQSENCRLCIVARLMLREPYTISYKCRFCPLSLGGYGYDHGYGCQAEGLADETSSRLSEMIRGGTKEQIQTAARNRLTWLLKRFHKEGILLRFKLPAKKTNKPKNSA